MMDWMLDTLLATSALILLVLIIRRPVAAYFGPIIAYSLWMIPAARLFMPSLTKTQDTITFDASSAIQNTASHIGNSANSSSVNIALDNANEITAISNVSAPSFDYMLPILMIWSSIAVIIFIFQMGRYLSLRDELLDNADEIGTQQGVTLIQSDIVSGPFAFGIFKKYIAIPMDFNKLFEPEMREMAIAHEMTHHRYYDLMINLGAFIFVCLTWFSPLSWYAWTKFRTDQESACDARVLKGADQETKHIYGKAIACSAAKETSTFLAAMSGPKTILTRLRRLKMPTVSKSRSFIGKASILAVTAIALPLTATTIPIAAQDIDKDQNIDNNSPTIKKTNGNPLSETDLSSEGQEQKNKSQSVRDSNTINQQINKERKDNVFNANIELEVSELKATAPQVTNTKQLANKTSKSVVVIITEDNGEIKKFDFKGDNTDKARTFWYENIDGSEVETNIDISDLNKKGDILKCTRKDDETEVCANSTIKLIMKDSLIQISNLKKEIRDTVHKTLKENHISKSERKKALKELEESLQKLDRELDELEADS